jgi:tRNA dimethylallyltransferase
MNTSHPLITVLGPTASGKTTFAVALAAALDTEIISADSRQVYRGMTIGTGKDLSEYVVAGKAVPYHLIDICDPGEKYNLFRYQRDFHDALVAVRSHGKTPVLCGGSGLYIEAVLKGYALPDAPENPELRQRLQDKSLPELKAILHSYKKLHNTTDVNSPQRAIRAIEIEEYRLTQPPGQRLSYPPVDSLIVGIDVDREVRRNRITARLKNRLDEEGLINEIQRLLDSGLSPEDLIYYGLEYKYVTLYVTGRLSYADMFTQLETAIHQFAKRQMTWFRGMEKRGLPIRWIPADLTRFRTIFPSVFPAQSDRCRG